MDQHQSPHNADLLPALDACRPGSDDLDRLLPPETAAAVRGDPALLLRHERVQKFDAAVARAFAAVDVPAGLSDRLLQALAADEASSTVQEASKVELSPDRLESTSRGMSRRRWLQVCGGAAASTAAGLAYFWFSQGEQPQELTVDQVLDQMLAFHQSPAATQGPVYSEPADVAPAEFPLPRLIPEELKRRGALRWRLLDGQFLGRTGAAYDLAPPDDPRAVIYVLSSEGRRGSPSVPLLPNQPTGLHQPTGGLAMEAWREDRLINILVIEGDRRRMQREFLKPEQPVA